MSAPARAARTREAVLARYHTIMGRPAPTDPEARRVIFRSLERTLGPWLPAARDARILDVACGEGAVLAFLRARGYTDLAGFDLSPENVALCREAGLDFVRVHDALALDAFEPGRSFDAVLCLDVLEHLPKDEAVPFVAACARRLAPGGSLIVQTPNMGSVLGAFARHNDLTHEWGLTEATASELLVAAGFAPGDVEVRPAWEATTAAGRLREAYLRLLHRAVFAAAGAGRPRVPTKNLLVRGRMP